MAVVIALVSSGACKKSERAAEPHVSPFKPLLVGPVATVDAPEDRSTFPQEAPLIVIWRGSGGDTPSTELSIRIWASGRVRYTCGRGGTLMPERVAEIAAGFAQAGWKPTAAEAPRTEPQPCVTTTVQLSRDGKVERRDSGCGRVRDDIQDAVDFVQASIGPQPC
jgi:hypothetical protein